MPKNCSADVQAVIAHVDQVFTGSNQTAIDSIKSLFGLSDLTHLDDVAGACEFHLLGSAVPVLTGICSAK